MDPSHLLVNDDTKHGKEEDEERPANLAPDRASGIKHFKDGDKIENEDDETKETAAVGQHVLVDGAHGVDRTHGLSVRYEKKRSYSWQDEMKSFL